MAPQQQQLPDVQLAQMLNALANRASWQRTSDVNPPKLLRGVAPAATSLKGDWYGPIPVQKPSVLQLLTVAGADVTHLIYGLNAQPEDLTFSEGRGTPNAVGRVYALQVGDWYVYVPQLAGDPATYNLRMSDASSDLPAQQNALGDGGAIAGATVVTTLNRGAFSTARKNVTTAGTAVNLASLVVPQGFALVIKGRPTNTGFIWVGNSAANAQDHTVAYPLDAGEPIRLYVNNANLVWIDSDVNLEGVNIAVEQ